MKIIRLEKDEKFRENHPFDVVVKKDKNQANAISEQNGYSFCIQSDNSIIPCPVSKEEFPILTSYSDYIAYLTNQTGQLTKLIEYIKKNKIRDEDDRMYELFYHNTDIKSTPLEYFQKSMIYFDKLSRDELNHYLNIINTNMCNIINSNYKCNKNIYLLHPSMFDNCTKEFLSNYPCGTKLAFKIHDVACNRDKYITEIFTKTLFDLITSYINNIYYIIYNAILYDTQNNDYTAAFMQALTNNRIFINWHEYICNIYLKIADRLTSFDWSTAKYIYQEYL